MEGFRNRTTNNIWKYDQSVPAGLAMDRKDVLLISQKVGLDEDGVWRQLEAFTEKYPAGVMTKREFVEYCLEKDDTAEESLSEALFKIFDKDSSGSMDFSEYIMASRASKVFKLCH